jgi:hypothetical protein
MYQQKKPHAVAGRKAKAPHATLWHTALFFCRKEDVRARGPLAVVDASELHVARPDLSVRVAARPVAPTG